MSRCAFSIPLLAFLVSIAFPPLSTLPTIKIPTIPGLTLALTIPVLGFALSLPPIPGIPMITIPALVGFVLALPIPTLGFVLALPPLPTLPSLSLPPCPLDP